MLYFDNINLNALNSFKLADIIARISQFDKMHASKRQDKKRFKALTFDDETYYNSTFNLPRCSKDLDNRA